MNTIYFVATKPFFDKAVSYIYDGEIQVPLIFTDDLLSVAIKHKDKLNEKYSTFSFGVFKAIVDDDIEHVC